MGLCFRGQIMRTAFRWVFRLFLLLLAAVALLLIHTIWFKPIKPNWFYDRVFMEYGFQDPQMMSSMRMLPSWMDWYSDDLTDQSLTQEKKLQEKLRTDLETLRRYDRAGMNEADALNYDMLEYFLALQAEGEKYAHHNYPLNQLFGIQNEFPTFMATQHPVGTPAEAEDYLARLGKAPVMVAQVMEGLQVRERENITPPTFVVEKVLKEMRAFVAAEPVKNILYTSLVEKIDKAGEQAITAAQRKDILARTETAIRDRVYPAYGRFIAYYETLLPKTMGNNGVWALPDGKAFYAYAVKMHTTTDMTPDEVHQLGLSEVARIEAEMEAILQAEGLTLGSVGARVQGISKRPDQLYANTDAGRQQIIDDFQAIIDEIDKADIEFPNDLLLELDKMEFYCYETRQLIKAKTRPVVFITSNNEKELPDAFLRRCFFHYIKFPEADTMKQIVDVHFPNLKKELLAVALKNFYDVRGLPGLKKKPSTSELLDWLKLLVAEDIPLEALQSADQKVSVPPLVGALLKNEQDVSLFEKLVFMNQRNR